jgi:hypothetical protein
MLVDEEKIENGFRIKRASPGKVLQCQLIVFVNNASYFSSE